MTASTLLPPRAVVPTATPTTDDDKPVNALECSVHTLPKQLLREFKHVFGDQYLVPQHNNNHDTKKELLAIPTNQRARQDLVAVGDHIEQEKDRLLNVVCSFHKR